jgi:hypothetical protein
VTKDELEALLAKMRANLRVRVAFRAQSFPNVFDRGAAAGLCTRSSAVTF